jgi:hypothetical protein
MVYGPRRYGKTSLARAVEREVADEWGILAVHADLWGVSSIADIVGVLGRSYARVSEVFRVRRFLADLLGSVGFSVNLGQTLSVSYQGSATAEEERAALRALLEVPQRLASRAAGGRVLVVLDEMSPPRRAAFVALCKEPTDEPHSRTYMRRHGIKGSGALKSAFDGLEASGYLERGSPGTQPRPTDPLLAIWIRERMNGS